MKDKNCTCGYIREEELINQLSKIIDLVSINEFGMQDKLEAEIRRFQFFKNKVLGETDKDFDLSTQVNIRNYAKYILKQGSIEEKRELLSNFKSRLKLSNKKLTL